MNTPGSFRYSTAAGVAVLLLFGATGPSAAAPAEEPEAEEVPVTRGDDRGTSEADSGNRENSGEVMNSPPPVGGVLDVQPIREADPENPFQSREPEPEKQKPVLMPEGKWLFDCTGKPGNEGGQAVFVFNSRKPDVVLLPCKALERMEDLSAYGKRSLEFTISGRVYEYRGRNYLLMASGLRLSGEKEQTGAGSSGESKPEERGEKKKERKAASEEPRAPSENGENRDEPPKPIRMDVPGEPHPEVPKSASRSGGEAAGEGLVREGKKLVNREGRVDRRGERTYFIFDSGDPPMILLPNKKLQRMEDLCEYGEKPMRFRISGIVTQYRNRNYVTMTKMVVIPKMMEKL